MKVFISLPMHDRSNQDIRDDIKRIADIVKNRFGDCEIIHANDDATPPEGAGRLWWLGRAIQKLDGVDIIAFHEDWEKAKGCRIEHDVANNYGIATYFVLTNSFNC